MVAPGQTLVSSPTVGPNGAIYIGSPKIARGLSNLSTPGRVDCIIPPNAGAPVVAGPWPMFGGDAAHHRTAKP
jgi:hypothetical protein